MNVVENSISNSLLASKEYGNFPLPAMSINDLSDIDNAERFMDMYGDNLLYCFEHGKWLVWDGKKWSEDTNESVHCQVAVMLKETSALILANSEEYPKGLVNKAKNLKNVSRIEATVSHAKRLHTVRINELDNDAWLINCNNGIVDLTSGQLLPHCPEKLMTKMINVDFDPDAECPCWEQFIYEITGGDKELSRYIQKCLGYSLTGITEEQCMFILLGQGANGKSTMLEVMGHIVGSYAKQTPSSTLTVKRNEYINNDIARLAGARFVAAVEIDEGKSLSEALIKQLTGGDTITARFLRGEYFEYTPMFKLWLATNHKPHIRGTDNGIWRRIRLIPFNYTVDENKRDPDLSSKLKKELSGILAWMVKGCLLWQKEKLVAPAMVNSLTSDYRREMDIVANFIEDCCITENNVKETSAKLYECYNQWCTRNGEGPMCNREFSAKLLERGFQRTRIGSRGDRGYLGIMISNQSGTL